MLVPALTVPVVLAWAGLLGASPLTAQQGTAVTAPPQETPTQETPTETGEPIPGAALETAPEADPIADFYLSRCAGCHTVGGGQLTAPDLLPATAWPAEDLALAVERMEKNVGPLTDEQVEELVAFLQSPEVQPRIAAARERQVRELAATLEPASPALGRALFHGDETFRRGGVPCSACHRAGEHGGTLAVDLTDAHSRLGESALLSASTTPGFPLMQAAYRDHPVSRQEAVHLVAYLEEVSAARDGTVKAADAPDAPDASATPVNPVTAWGAALALAVLVLLTLPLLRHRDRRRLAGRGVRAALVRKALRS